VLLAQTFRDETLPSVRKTLDMTLSDLSRWARGHGLEAVLIATGAVLLARLVRWGADRLIARSQQRDQRDRDAGLVPSEAAKHEGALVQVGAWSSIAVIYFVAALLLLERLNVPLSSVVAPATVAGVALGFGAQRLAQDLISGFFIFAERQYGYGDVLRIAPPGDATGITGTVEEITLRTTKLRTVNGELIILPNGEIRQVVNLSKDWARVVLDIPLAADANVPKAADILRRIGDEIAADEEWEPLLLDAPSVMGIEKFGVGFLQLRFVARTLPGKQWEVGRELRGRIAEAFREAGIIAAPSVVASGGPSGL
jgi:small-conductance mechanosensitive channel